MVNQVNIEQGYEALRRHYGGKPLEASHEDGPNLMSEAMMQELGISKQEADQVVRALVEAQTVRWVAGNADTGLHGYWHI